MWYERRGGRSVKSEFQIRLDEEAQLRASAFDQIADSRDRWRAKNRAYYAAIERLVKFVVPEGASVLEVGCGTGDLLAALKPSRGVGLDISEKQLEIARRKHAGLEFLHGDAETLDLGGRTFDYVVIS